MHHHSTNTSLHHIAEHSLSVQSTLDRLDRGRFVAGQTHHFPALNRHSQKLLFTIMLLIIHYFDLFMFISSYGNYIHPLGILKTLNISKNFN